MWQVGLWIYFLLLGTGAYAQGQNDELLSMLLIGDSGTGEQGQYQVAQAMKAYCQQNDCDFSFLLGDNIYEGGVNSVNDPQFHSKFEKPFENLPFKFYAILGNHDILTGSEGIEAQIQYTQHSSKWTMPSRYYRFNLANIEFFALDTNTFGSEDPEQIAWLKSALQASKASYKIVFGHHPLYSSGSHAYWDAIEGYKLKKLRQSLEPLLCEQHVLAYFAGHDHHLEVNRSACGVVHVVSGAAAKARPTYKSLEKKNRETLLFSQGKVLGFSLAQIANSSFLLKIIDRHGKPLYTNAFPLQPSQGG